MQLRCYVKTTEINLINLIVFKKNKRICCREMRPNQFEVGDNPVVVERMKRLLVEPWNSLFTQRHVWTAESCLFLCTFQCRACKGYNHSQQHDHRREAEIIHRQHTEMDTHKKQINAVKSCSVCWHFRGKYCRTNNALHQYGVQSSHLRGKISLDNTSRKCLYSDTHRNVISPLHNHWMWI